MDFDDKNIPALNKLADKIAQVNINPQNVEQHIHLPNPTMPLPSNISSPKGFIGREAELTNLHQAKTDGKTSFVLHGIGGVGKTDLALKFIDGIKVDYLSHIRVDMFGLSDKPTTANDAKLEIIRMFKPDVPTDIDEKDINNIYISLLNQHKTILFFDNAKDRDQVIPLSKDVPALVIITSRTNLYVTGCFSLPVEQMSPADARKLLYSVADEPRFDGQADALAYLAGYLPMALLPLGGMLAEYITLEPVDLVEKYKERKERLQLADPNRENLSVEASFDLSYERLSEELQTCWRKLAVFPADFDLEAIQAIWQIEDGKTVRDELVNKHLLEFNKDTKRFHLHDLARDYTNEKISVEEFFESEFLFSSYFGDLLKSLNNNINIDSLRIFDSEILNIEQGFNWVVDKINLDTDFATICVWYVGVSNQILLIRLHFRKYIKWMETGLIAAQNFSNQQTSQAIKGSCLGNLGIAYRNLGKYEEAILYIKDSLKIARNLSDNNSERVRLGNLANCYFSIGNYLKAIDYNKKAIEIALQLKDQNSRGIHLNNLGICHFRMKNHRDAIKYFQESLEIAREHKNIQLESNNLANLASINSELGEYENAILYNQQALKLAKQISDRKTEGEILGNLGHSYQDLGKNSLAKDYYQQAISILEPIESPNAKVFRRYLAELENLINEGIESA